MIKYIAYCRKSTDKKDKQVLSIEAQITEEKSKAVKKSFQLFADGNSSFTAISQFMFKFGIKREGEKPVKVGQVKNMLSNSPLQVWQPAASAAPQSRRNNT